MKNKIPIYFLSLAVLLPSTVFAQSLLDRYAPGTSYNPIEMQIVQDPMEQLRLELNALESRLKMQYGYSLYSSCMPSSCLTADSIRDLSTRSSCLQTLEYKLGNKLCEAQKPACPYGTTLWNGSCYTPDQGCRANYGDHVSSKRVTAEGKFECDCDSGYQWDPTGANRCVAIPVQKTQDQLCAETYPNSRLIGGYCACPSGYQLNDARTRCDAVPVKTNDQVCQDSFGSNSNWDGTKTSDGQLNCACKIGFTWNAERTSCVFVPAPSSAPSGGGGGGGGGYTPTVPPTPSVISTFTYNAELAHDISRKEMVTNGSATLRSCPARTCEQKGVYPNGTIFTVRQKYGEGDLWYRGTTPDGNDGWIYSELLTERKVVVTENNVISGPATSTILTPEPVQALTENQEPVVPKKSTWKKIIGWFAFWR